MALDGSNQSRSQTAAAPPYANIRDRLFQLQASEVGVEPSETFPRVWGVVMEFTVQDTFMTLLALADGTTKLYFSGGTTIAGAGERARVAAARDKLIALAQQVDSQLQPTEEYPLPQRDRVRFYLMTFDGVRTAEVSGTELGTMQHALSPLCLQGNEVITAIRTSTETRQSPQSQLVNLGFKDNVLQAIIIAACIPIGAISGGFLVKDRLPGILMGGFLGLIAGFLGSGILLMVIGAVRRTRQRGD